MSEIVDMTNVQFVVISKIEACYDSTTQKVPSTMTYAKNIMFFQVQKARNYLKSFVFLSKVTTSKEKN